MRIESREDFVRLLLGTMSKISYIIETFDLKRELSLMMEDKRYDNLFYFVSSLDDLDLFDVLVPYRDKGFIELRGDRRKVTIDIRSQLFSPFAKQILEGFDDSLIAQMAQMIRELDIGRNIGLCSYGDITTVFKMVNPNGIYTVERKENIVTDGDVRKAPEIKTGAVVVENASFLSKQIFNRGKLNEFQFYYRFDNKSDIWRLAKHILSYLDAVERKKKNLPIYSGEEVLDKFTELDKGLGYRYKR